MSHTLTQHEFLTIRHLLRAGWRHVQIARELNISVWTIARIADRRRFLPEELGADEVPADELCEDDSPPDYTAQNLRRCPGCGAMVYLWPCIACGHGVSTSAIAPPQEVKIEPPPASRIARFRHRQKRQQRRYVKQKLLECRGDGAASQQPESALRSRDQVG